jgi:N-acetylmuramoyl-L-alanine amidase
MNPRLRLLALALLAAIAPAAWSDASLRGFDVESASASGVRITLRVSGPTSERVLNLDNPNRLVIDLPATRLAGGLKLPKSAGPVTSVRSGTQPGRTLRLVLQHGGLPSKVRDLGGDHGIIIEFGDAISASGAVQPAVAAAPVAVKPRHAPEDSGRDIVIAIDAGHGGQDPGATGRSGTREKDVVLGIARALARRIDAEPGMRAVLTRDSDVFIVHRERMNIARRGRADMFISVHADAIANRDVSGSSVYVLSEKGATNEAARWLAQRENAADLKGGVSLGDKSDQLATVLMDLSQDASIGASLEAAQRVLAELDLVGTIRKSQVQQAAFLVLKSPDIPSLLIETAYISNPGEERKLRDAGYQAELADAIFRGAREYFRRSPPDGTLFARQQKSRGSSPIIAGSAAP